MAKKALDGQEFFQFEKIASRTFSFSTPLQEVRAPRNREQKYLTCVVYSSCKKVRPEECFRAFLFLSTESA